MLLRSRGSDLLWRAGRAVDASGFAGRWPLQKLLSPVMAPKAATDRTHMNGSSCPPGKPIYKNRLRAGFGPRALVCQPLILRICIVCAEKVKFWWETAGLEHFPARRDSNWQSLTVGRFLQVFACYS